MTTMTNKKKLELVQKLEAMITEVSGKWMVAISEIMDGNRGTTDASEARSVAMYYAVVKLGMSRADVGRLFAGRDVSGVAHAVGRVICRRIEDKEFDRKVRGVGV